VGYARQRPHDGIGGGALYQTGEDNPRDKTTAGRGGKQKTSGHVNTA